MSCHPFVVQNIQKGLARIIPETRLSVSRLISALCLNSGIGNVQILPNAMDTCRFPMAYRMLLMNERAHP